MIGNYIKAVAPSVSRTTAQLMKTGQTVSQQTGDDGDLEAGRNVDFTTLAENNPFGNTNRFTSTTGNQTYTNTIIIDWSTYNGNTVLGWSNTLRGGTSATWSQNIAAALLLNIGGFSSGWRIPNITELLSIISFGFNPTTYVFNFLNYSPFNILANLSTSSRASTNSVYKINVSAGSSPAAFSIVDRFSQTNSYIACRTFTVTGTTLS
jgi:hypothetical protein